MVLRVIVTAEQKVPFKKAHSHEYLLLFLMYCDLKHKYEMKVSPGFSKVFLVTN